MTRTIAALFAIELALFAGLGLAIVDRRAHQRLVGVGVNQWGYRDEARGSKEKGEIRVALVGGSAAFEGGRRFDQTLAGQLYIELRNEGARAGRLYSVANVAEPRAGSDTYVRTLGDFMYLEPDVVCIFDGYDTLTGLPPHARRRSMVFRATGYLPLIAPTLVVGRPWMSDEDGGIAPILRDRDAPVDVSCGGASARYCEAIAETVAFGLGRVSAVIVASPPAVSRRHREQQRSLAALLDRRFGPDRRFTYLDLTGVMRLDDPVHSPDGIHRTPIGNHVVAQRIASTILRWPAIQPAR